MIVVRNRELMFDPALCMICEARAHTVVILRSEGRPPTSKHLTFCPGCFATLQSNINAYAPVPSTQ